MYVVLFRKDGKIDVKTHGKIYCRGIRLTDKDFVYALCQDQPNANNPGFRFFNMENTIRDGTCKMILLKDIDVGCIGNIEFSVTTLRYGFLNSVTKLIVTPMLHRIMQRLIGYPTKDEIICYNVIRDQVVCLDKQGNLLTWNLFTGKYENYHKITNIDLKKY